MPVWTISAQEGAGADQVAAELAAAAGVPLLDRNALASLAHDIDPDHLEAEDFQDIERRFGGRLAMLAFSMAITTTASADALQELQFRRNLPKLGRSVISQAARLPCVILAPAAFVAFPDHPGAIHVRLRAPLTWRIAAHKREHLVDRRSAEKAVKRDDHLKRAWVRALYHVDLDDDNLFTLALDTSRLSTGRLVDTLLAAAGVQATLLAT